ncbi:hypothetical protein B566_EDAN017212 [Ephemera danica]|nr:hypothetical protein B566_EDAN017212 [Ephemera danica]
MTPVVLLLCVGLAAMTQAGVVSSTEGQQPGVVGVRKLATSNDCVSVVAFAGTGAQVPTENTKPLTFRSSLLDKGVGWSKDTGEFTCHCPGLYQFSFASGAKVSLKKQTSGTEAWDNVVSTGMQGGSNMVLLDMEVGDKAALWAQDGGKIKDDEQETTLSFCGYRIAKK